jgi:hypothetical protein
MKWCCVGFEQNYGLSSLRGICIVYAHNEEHNGRFVLRFRAIDQDNEAGAVASFPISVTTDVVLTWCPFCGANLLRFYGRFFQDNDFTHGVISE